MQQLIQKIIIISQRAFSGAEKFSVPGIILLHAVYFAVAVTVGYIYTNDSPEYLHQAKNIITYGSFYAEDWQQKHVALFYTLRPPLYAVFIMLVKIIINSDIAVIFIQNLLGIFTLLAFRKFLLKIFPGTPAGAYILLMLFFYPPWLIYTNAIMADLLFSVLLIWGIMFFYYFINERKEKHYLLFNLLFGLAVLVKPVLLYFWIINLIFCTWLYFQKQQKKIWIYAFIMPLIIIMWSSYNFYSTGYFHFSASKAINMVYFNASSLIIFTEGQSAADSMMRAVNTGAAAFTDINSQLSFYENSGKEVILKKPVTYVWLHAQMLLRFIFSPGRECVMEFLKLQDNVPVSFMQEVKAAGFSGIIKWLNYVSPGLLILSFFTIIFNLLLFSAFILYIIFVKDGLVWKSFIFTLAAYISVLSAAGVTLARLRMPLVPVMIICLLALTYILIKKVKNNPAKA